MQDPFWKPALKAYMGPRRAYQTPEELVKACATYFDWANQTPLKADKVFSYQGSQSHEDERRVRAFTLTGMCCHIGISIMTWSNYRRVPELAEACEFLEQILYTQKFEAAAADLLNPAMLTRDLGLADRLHQEVKGETEITFRRVVVDKQTPEEPS